jgi:hypothetical protein
MLYKEVLGSIFQGKHIDLAKTVELERKNKTKKEDDVRKTKELA